MSSRNEKSPRDGPGSESGDRRLARLLEEALGRDRAEAESYLLEQTEDPELAAAVMRLLESESGNTGFLASPIEPDRHLNEEVFEENEQGISYAPAS